MTSRGEPGPGLAHARTWLEQKRGAGVTRVEALPGGAGKRSYWRVHFTRGHSAVLMHAIPEDPLILPPALRAPGPALPFVEVTSYLASQGLPVPVIEAIEVEERWILLEDLGSTHLCDLSGAELRARLEEAARLLARIHELQPGDALPFRRRFDLEWIRFELDTFVAHGRLEVSDASLRAALEPLAQAVAELPQTLCLRDYQSQNLMVDPNGRLRVIDYQDALLAPAELDLAAFLHDSYIEIGDSDRDALLDCYVHARGVTIEPERLAMLVVQRKCKDLGRYRYLVEERGDTRYASFLDRALQSVHGALEALPRDLEGVRRFLRDALGAPR